MSRFRNYKMKNNVSATLFTNISSSATAIQVNEGEGERFWNEFPMLATLENFNSDDSVFHREIVSITARENDTLTVERHKYPCLASDDANTETQNSYSFNSGDKISVYIPKDILDRINAGIKYLEQNGTDRLKVLAAISGDPLKIDVMQWVYRTWSNTRQFPGQTNIALTANANNYVQIGFNADIIINTDAWDTRYARLARVLTDANWIVEIEDRRLDTVWGALGSIAIDELEEKLNLNLQDYFMIADSEDDYNNKKFSYESLAYWQTFGNGSDWNLVIPSWACCMLEAKAYQFNNLTICSGWLLRFCGDGVPVLRVKGCFCNMWKISTYWPHVTAKDVALQVWGVIHNVKNVCNWFPAFTPPTFTYSWGNGTCGCWYWNWGKGWNEGQAWANGTWSYWGAWGAAWTCSWWGGWWWGWYNRYNNAYYNWWAGGAWWDCIGWNGWSWGNGGCRCTIAWWGGGWGWYWYLCWGNGWTWASAYNAWPGANWWDWYLCKGWDGGAPGGAYCFWWAGGHGWNSYYWVWWAWHGWGGSWAWGNGWFSVCGCWWNWGNWWWAVNWNGWAWGAGWFWAMKWGDGWAWGSAAPGGKWWDSIFWNGGNWGNGWWATNSYDSTNGCKWGKGGCSIFGNWWNAGNTGNSYANHNQAQPGENWGDSLYWTGWTWGMPWASWYWVGTAWQGWYWRNGWVWGATKNSQCGCCDVKWWRGGDAWGGQYALFILACRWYNTCIDASWWAWGKGWAATSSSCWTGGNWGNWWVWGEVMILYRCSFTTGTVNVSWWAGGAGGAGCKASGTAGTAGRNGCYSVAQLIV